MYGIYPDKKRINYGQFYKVFQNKNGLFSVVTNAVSWYVVYSNTK